MNSIIEEKTHLQVSIGVTVHDGSHDAAAQHVPPHLLLLLLLLHAEHGPPFLLLLALHCSNISLLFSICQQQIFRLC